MRLASSACDYEYERNGTANIFMMFAPLEGWRHVEVTLGLYDDGGQVCAVFQATDWLERAVDQVGRGETGQRGQPM